MPSSSPGFTAPVSSAANRTAWCRSWGGSRRTRSIITRDRLRMSDHRDRLRLAYNTFFAEVEAATPTDNRAAFRCTVVERGRLEEARLTLQLCLKAGEVLETAESKVVLTDQPIELKPEEVG